MKRIHKTWLAGTLAAGLLIGGGFVLQHNQAFANDTSTTTPAPKKGNFQDKHKGFNGQNNRGFANNQARQGGFGFGGAMDFATILGIDASVLKEEIKQGKTIVQIAQDKANLSEEALLAKLTEAETKKIDTALSEGKLKQEQADKLKAGLADRLKKIVEATPQAMNFDKKPMPRGGGFPGGVWGNPKEIATILGITEDELAAERKAGKSLAEIAQAKGMTEDQLIAKLKDSMTNQIKSFVERKGGDQPKPQPRSGDTFKGKPGRGGEHKPAPSASPTVSS